MGERVSEFEEKKKIGEVADGKKKHLKLIEKQGSFSVTTALR